MTEYELAQSYFQQSYESNIQIGNDSGIASALFSLGNTSKRLGKETKLMIIIQKVLKLVKNRDLNRIALARWGLGTIDNERGHYKKALKNLEIALENNIAIKIIISNHLLFYQSQLLILD